MRDKNGILIILVVAVLFLFLLFGGNIFDFISSLSKPDHPPYNFDKASTIEFFLGGLYYKTINFTFNKDTMESSYDISVDGEHYSNKEIWTEKKFNSFIDNLRECNFEKWTGDYIDEPPQHSGVFYESYGWSISIKNGSETILFLNGNRFPGGDKWDKFINVMAKYVDPHVKS